MSEYNILPSLFLADTTLPYSCSSRYYLDACLFRLALAFMLSNMPYHLRYIVHHLQGKNYCRTPLPRVYR
jgi:hypothetical protein